MTKYSLANRYLRFFGTCCTFLQGSISSKLREQIFLKPDNTSQPSVILIWNTKYHFATKLPIEKRSVVNSNQISCEIFVWTVYYSSENPSLVHNLLKISQGHSTHITSGAEQANLLDAGSFHLHITWKCNSPTLVNFSTSCVIAAYRQRASKHSLCVS